MIIFQSILLNQSCVARVFITTMKVAVFHDLMMFFLSLFQYYQNFPGTGIIEQLPRRHTGTLNADLWQRIEESVTLIGLHLVPPQYRTNRRPGARVCVGVR